MLETLHQIYQINATGTINGILYFLKKVPLIKNIFKNTQYRLSGLKSILGVLSIIIMILRTLLLSLLGYLMIFLPSIFLAGDTIPWAVASLIFFIYYLPRILSSELLAYEPNKFIMVRQMHMDPKSYALASTIPHEILKFLMKALLFNAMLPFGTFWTKTLIALSISAFALFVEALHLFLYDRFGFNIAQHNTLVLVPYFLIFASAYFLPFTFPTPVFLSILTSPVFLLVTILSGVLGGFYLLRFDKYGQAIAETNNVENMVKIRQTQTDARSQDIKVRDKDLRARDIDTSQKSQREGYAYLNDIFFKRHRRMVYRPMLIKSGIILAVFVALFIASELFLPVQEAAPSIAREFYDQFTIFVFVMYLLCNTLKIIRSMFYNLDLSLLRYGFYKKGDSLLKMFTIRLRTLIGYNFVPTTFLAAGVTFSILWFTDIPFLSIIPVILLLYTLALFFSVHYIFMYYIFQPYTSSMQMKSPFFGLINFLVYFFSWMLLQIPAPPAVFLPIMMALLILYTAVALFLVYRKAPQTFRVR